MRSWPLQLFGDTAVLFLLVHILSQEISFFQAPHTVLGFPTLAKVLSTRI